MRHFSPRTKPERHPVCDSIESRDNYLAPLLSASERETTEAWIEGIVARDVERLHHYSTIP